ncbi:TetR/AcrR family transcriptional regulator [Micromonospora saelicesensis]|uniref:TetR/AcrR family transcriptional regulator n=1 Tax=Micromonospora saelicesensis TaxID=285676 RepID=UPI003CEDEAE8
MLEAAVRAFDESGYERASIQHIAELAGTSKSLVTYYFPTKQTLASAVISLAYPGAYSWGPLAPPAIRSTRSCGLPSM